VVGAARSRATSVPSRSRVKERAQKERAEAVQRYCKRLGRRQESGERDRVLLFFPPTSSTKPSFMAEC
jgi:hypothetical protein